MSYTQQPNQQQKNQPEVRGQYGSKDQAEQNVKPGQGSSAKNAGTQKNAQERGEEYGNDMDRDASSKTNPYGKQH